MNYRFEVLNRRVCHQGFFRLDKLTVRHDRFAGGHVEITREILERGHAAAMLLYDPARDELVMLEQFRVGALDSPDGPWLLEIVAGIIEQDEAAEAVVKREAVEEAGCQVDLVEYVSRFIVSPGGCSEQMYLFCGRVDATGAGGRFGLAHEGEDIRCFVMPADQAEVVLSEGKVMSATTVIALQWFVLNRKDLRRRWLST